MELWKKLFLLFLSCIILMISCVIFDVVNSPIPKTQNLVLSNFSNHFKFIGKDLNQSNHIFKLDLSITGEVSGKAILTINNPESTALREFQIAPDTVSVNYSGDWYYDSFILDFKSDSSTTGTLNFEYTFYNLP